MGRSILITGAAGMLGAKLVEGLASRHRLRGFDRVPVPQLEDMVVGDLTDIAALSEALQGIDVVIHLAAASRSIAPWEEVLLSNIVGCYNVFEAARLRGVRRIVFASRAGLLISYPANMMRTVDMAPRPDSYYSVSKVFGENLGYMYATHYQMEFVSVRIGGFSTDKPEPAHPHDLGHQDAVRVFERAAIHPGVGYEIVFAVSDSNWPLYDLDHGRRVIGYEPGQRSIVDPSQFMAG